MENSQKNLPATERKLQKTREQGQTWRSRDLAHLSILGLSIILFFTFGSKVFVQLKNKISQSFNFNYATIFKPPKVILDRFNDFILFGIFYVLLFAFILSIAIILINLSTGGFICSFNNIKPKLNKINPLSGIKNLFSKRHFFTTIKNTICLIIILIITGIYLKNNILKFTNLNTNLLQNSADFIFNGLILTLLFILLMTLIDIPLQKYLFLNGLKMSHQEVKNENKEVEGSPEIKQKLRQKQQEIANRASIVKVPKADFILINPQHYSVAIHYDEATMSAPQVISKGSDILALKIREIAKEHKILVLTSPMLARALYANSEIDQPIPITLFKALAQVIAYVYRFKAGERPPYEWLSPAVPEELDPHHPEFIKSNQKNKKRK